MNIYYNKDETVTLKMLPICDCGYIFRNGIHIEKVVDEIQEFKHVVYSINPPHCPKCGRLIKGVIYE